MSDEPTPDPARPVFDTTVRRLHEKAVDDPEVLSAVLEAGTVAHLGVALEGLPYVVPLAYAPYPASTEGIPRVVLHGSTGSRLFRAAAAGAPCAVTITLLDGLVLARSAFESSMEYRCAMLYGTCRSLDGTEKKQALERLTDHLLPGRRDGLRETTAKEYAATSVLLLEAHQWSMKISSGFADDSEDDIRAVPQLWAGVIPLETVAGSPIPDPHSTALPQPRWGRNQVRRP